MNLHHPFERQNSSRLMPFDALPSTRPDFTTPAHVSGERSPFVMLRNQPKSIPHTALIREDSHRMATLCLSIARLLARLLLGATPGCPIPSLYLGRVSKRCERLPHTASDFSSPVLPTYPTLEGVVAQSVATPSEARLVSLTPRFLPRRDP